MGIYAQESKSKEQETPDGGRSWIETSKTPDITRTRRVVAEPWESVRTYCYCCSCDDRGYGDPYCRNHGFAAERPCETHGFPGQADDEGVMPESVQKVLARLAP